MNLRKKNQTAHPLPFLMVLSSDGRSPATSDSIATPDVWLGKDGGTGAVPSGAISEIDKVHQPGWWKVAPNATDCNTLGPLIVHAEASGADVSDEEFQVVAFDPDAALATGDASGRATLSPSGLDAITATAPAGVPTTFTQMLVMLYRRFFKKSTCTATQIKTYADDGTTAITTQTVSDDGTTQTQGTAT